MMPLSSASHFTGLRIDANDFALFDKKRNAHDETGFHRGLFGGSPGRGIATHSQFRRDDCKFDELRQL
jgi:hypothetical protein